MLKRFFTCLLITSGLYLPASVYADGAGLYARHCAACHGAEGNGGVGVPLALPAFLKSVDDAFLSKSIRDGRPGRVMPAFSKLSDVEVKSLVKYIRSWSDSPAATFSTVAVHGNARHGKKLFAKFCASCHGANGEGGHGTGVTFSRPRDLPIIAPAINNAGFLTSASDQLIKRTLMQGREGTPMVSFLKQGMTEADINDVVAYVRSFEKNQSNQTQESFDKEPLTLAYESPYDMKGTIDRVKAAAKGKNFRIIREQKLENGLVKQSEENPNQVIVYFCNFQLLNQALTVDPRVGLFLPCRVTISESKGQVVIYAINPKRLSKLFNNHELNKLCDGMYETYTSILEEATL
ncbi:MAG: c-type cytochrome [Gammaproteobacteria bacterium]|nr:c-type cytochrome [Gammaproteobacteria bacterium]MDH5776597.1 c-type cytochrome [Gammaproteobacteria bacterium]